MTERVVYANGNIVPESQARISIYDSALMFGDMVFEMTRSFNKKQFKLREHIDRLFYSMKCTRINCGMTKQDMEDACHQVIDRNDPLFEDDDEHRLMINVTRGPLSTYKDVVGLEDRPTVIIADFPLRWTVRGMGKLYVDGINAVIPSQRTIPFHLLDPRVKNRNRLHYQMANIEVSGYAGSNNWALLLDTDGYVSEGTGSNFFIVKNGTCFTPEGRNVLRGISRDYIYTLHPDGYSEKNITVYDVMTADEAFMTATPFCILPVVSLNGSPIGTGSVGNVTKWLLNEWSNAVGVNIPQQIQMWDQGVVSGTTPYSFAKK